MTTATKTGTLGERIKGHRTAIPGMTQRRLGDAVGVTEGMVGKWEGDKAVPSPENKLALAKALGVVPAEMDYDMPVEFSPVSPPWFTAAMEQRAAAEAQILNELTAIRKAMGR